MDLPEAAMFLYPTGAFLEIGLKPVIYLGLEKLVHNIFGRIKTISKNTLSPLTISSRQKREQDLEAAVFSVSVFSFYWRTELQQRRLGL